MLDVLVFYGSYRRDRVGIRLARYSVGALTQLGYKAELIDAQAIGLPMLDRMFKEYPPGEAPPPMAGLAKQIREADGFLFVVGEYNWGMQPGLKNLTDHFLEEWFWRPAAIVSYSPGRLGGSRAATSWHGTLSEMGMVVISSTMAIGGIADALDDGGRPTGDGGAAIETSFPRLGADLAWWANAAKRQRNDTAPPY
jgi:NAD(P)H-dependent FMN reductase